MLVNFLQFFQVEAFAKNKIQFLAELDLLIERERMNFRLPLRWREARRVMTQQDIARACDDDYFYRVPSRILRDWVDVQMALVELEVVQLQEVFLPYIVQKNGQTLFENISSDPSRLL